MPPSPKKDITAKTPNKVTIPFGIAIALPLLAPLYGKKYLLKAKNNHENNNTMYNCYLTNT